MQEVILAENKGELIIRDYDKLLTQYVMVLYDSGLSKLDCMDIGKIIIKLMKMKRNFEERLKKEKLDFKWWENSKFFAQSAAAKRIELLEIEENIRDLGKLIWDYEKIYQFLRKEMNPRGMMEFVREESSLIHLIYTNNSCSFKPSSVSSFKCLCQFHVERTPSLSINETTGHAFCYGCGLDFDVIDYLKRYEHISATKAISLLAKVYLLDIGKHKKKASGDLVNKYRSTLLSDEYRTLIERGYERACGYENSVERERAILKFEKDMATIDRVKRGEYVKFKRDDGRKLALKRPDLEEE